MKFCANISMLFTEVPFIDRIDLAARAGFTSVEFWWPTTEPTDAVVDAVQSAGVDVALMNFFAGDMQAGERGILNDPSRISDFREHAPSALELANRLGCQRLNALVGNRLADIELHHQMAIAEENITWAADLAASQNAEVMVEPLSAFENPSYLLTTTRSALDFIDRIDRPNVRLQYDVFQMQRMEGNLADTLRSTMPRIGHIQIGDCPGRHEPGTGEINFPYLLNHIDSLGYTGHVGLEYRPSRSTLESLTWLPQSLRDASDTTFPAGGDAA